MMSQENLFNTPDWPTEKDSSMQKVAAQRRKRPARRRNRAWNSSPTAANFVDSIPAFPTKKAREHFVTVLQMVADEMTIAARQNGPSGKKRAAKRFRISSSNFPSRKMFYPKNLPPQDIGYRQCLAAIAMGFVDEKTSKPKIMFRLQDEIADKLKDTEEFIKSRIAEANILLPKSLQVSFADLQLTFSQVEDGVQRQFRFGTEFKSFSDKRKSTSSVHRMMALLGIISILEVAESELTWGPASVDDSYLFFFNLVTKMSSEFGKTALWYDESKKNPSDIEVVEAYFKKEKKRPSISQASAVMAGVYPGWLKFYKGRNFIPAVYKKLQR